MHGKTGKHLPGEIDLLKNGIPDSASLYGKETNAVISTANKLPRDRKLADEIHFIAWYEMKDTDGHLTRPERKGVCQKTQLKVFASGKIIFAEGTLGHVCYLVLAGSVSIFIEGAGEVEVARPGQIIGASILTKLYAGHKKPRYTSTAVAGYSKDGYCYIGEISQETFNLYLGHSFAQQSLGLLRHILLKPPEHRTDDDLEMMVSWLITHTTCATEGEWEALTDMAQHATYERVGEGQVCIKQGQPGDSFHIVLSGTMVVLIDDVGVVSKLGIGQHFGENALLGDVDEPVTTTPTSTLPCEATVVATHGCVCVELIRLDKQLFDRCLARSMRIIHPFVLQEQASTRKWYSTACTMHSTACTMHYTACTMHYTACTMHYTACTMHYTACTMH
jgi:CRP-like cAMP-binding protein